MNNKRQTPPLPGPPSWQGAMDETRAVYADLEKRPMERQCERRTECCQFRLTGSTPMLTWSEALVLAAGVRAAGRTKVLKREDGVCPLLDQLTGKCIVYASRPFGCRTHFCQAAGGPATRAEVLDLIRRLEHASADLGDGEVRSLPTVLNLALDELAARKKMAATGR